MLKKSHKNKIIFNTRRFPIPNPGKAPLRKPRMLLMFSFHRSSRMGTPTPKEKDI
jgi:hypothetical protein